MVYLILAWHRVCAVAGDPLAVNPSDFRRQLASVGRRYRVVTLGELAGRIFNPGGAPARDRLAAITFDDGYHDNFAVAAPILREHGFPATFFLAAGYLDGKRPFPRRAPAGPAGRDRMMTAGEATALVAEGFTVGSHTLTHPNLANLARTEAEAEIRGSKDTLERMLGASVEFFCYPGGRFTPETAELAAAAGYRAAVVTFPYRFGPRRLTRGRVPDRFALPRVGVYRHTGELAFRLKTAVPLQGRGP